MLFILSFVFFFELDIFYEIFLKIYSKMKMPKNINCQFLDRIIKIDLKKLYNFLIKV